MAGGGKSVIQGANDLTQLAYVVNNRLLVDTGTSGGGPTSDVNIASVGGVLVTSPLPVTAFQGTNPWVVSGSLSVVGTVTVDVASFIATGLVSVGNSTTTTLLAGATFTGTFENVKDYAAVTVTVFSTQASAVDGMKLQWSHNGINVDQENSVTVQANAGRAFSIPVEGLFFRIVYTNGAVGQVTFRLGIVYKPTAAGLNAVSIDQDINASGAIVVGTRSLITGETTAGGGAFVNVKVTPSGAIVADVGTVPVSGPIGVTQVTNPWVVSGTVNIGNTPLLVDQNLPPWSVTVASIVPGTGATNLGKAEDAVHTSGDVGVMPLAVRQDAQTPLAANGDYIPLVVNSVGSLYTTVTGGVAVTSVIPGNGTTSLGKAEDAIHASGDTGVMALAVRQDTAAALSANGDYIPLTVDALGNLRTGGASTTGLGKAEDAPHASGDVGVMMLAVRQDVASPLAANGDYIPLSVSAGAELRVVTSLNSSMQIASIVPGTDFDQLGKAEDNGHVSGDVGVFALAVRNDNAANALTDNDLDYSGISVDEFGVVWVRNIDAGETMATVAFSASTRGRPVQIAATATAGTLIHTASTTNLDRIYLSLTNTSTSAVTVTVEWGAAGLGNEIYEVIPAKETIEVLDGIVLGGAAGGDTVRAYASTASVVNAFGRVERLTP